MDRKINKSGILKRIWPLLLLSLITLFLSGCVWTPTDDPIATLDPALKAIAATQTRTAFCEQDPDVCKVKPDIKWLDSSDIVKIFTWDGSSGFIERSIVVSGTMKDGSGNWIYPAGNVNITYESVQGFVQSCTGKLSSMSNTNSSEYNDRSRIASCSVTLNYLGNYIIQAVYEGDEKYAGVYIQQGAIMVDSDWQEPSTPTATMTLIPIPTATETK